MYYHIFLKRFLHKFDVSAGRSSRDKYQLCHQVTFSKSNIAMDKGYAKEGHTAKPQ